MEYRAMDPTGGNVPVDTSYAPHHRSRFSELDREEMAELSEEYAFLNAEKEVQHDPESGPVTPAHASTPPAGTARGVGPGAEKDTDPMIMPSITVTSHDSGSARSMQGSRARSARSSQHTTTAIFFARTRFLLLLFSFATAIVILGGNAHMIMTYRKYRTVGKPVNHPKSSRLWWDAWPKKLNQTPTTVYLAGGAVSTAIMGALMLAQVRTSMRYLSSKTLVIVMGVPNLLLMAGWFAISLRYYFLRPGRREWTIGDWSCAHVRKDLYGLDQFNFSVLCTEYRFSTFGAITDAGVHLLIFLTLVAGCVMDRKPKSSASYGKLPKPASLPRRLRLPMMKR